MMSDGEDTVNSEVTLDTIFEKYGEYISGSKMRSIFQVVGIGTDSDVKIGKF